MRRGDTVTVGRLIGASVWDADGRRLGTVVDLGITGLPEPEVKALILGAGALAWRLHVAVPPAAHAERWAEMRRVPWAEVEKVRGRVIHLRRH